MALLSLVHVGYLPCDILGSVVQCPSCGSFAKDGYCIVGGGFELQRCSGQQPRYNDAPQVALRFY